MGRTPKQTFLYRRHTEGQQTYENTYYDICPIIREKQIKSKKRQDAIPFRMAITEKTIITNVSKDVEKREPSYTIGGNIN